MTTFAKRSNGRWQAKIRRLGRPSISKTFRTKSDAVAWAHVQESELERGVWRDRSVAERTTLHQLLEQYLREIVPQKRGADSETSRVKTLLRDPIAAYGLANLSAPVVAKWRDGRLGAGAAGSTVNRELNLLSAVMNWARRDLGIAFENPVADIRRPPQPNSRDRRLMEGEVRFLDEATRDRDGKAVLTSGKRYRIGARNSIMNPLFRFALETAMRQGEIVVLRWENVDLQKRTAKLDMTKNGERRTVPLSSAALAILQELPRTEDRAFPVSSEAVKRSWIRSVVRARTIYEADCVANGVEADRRFLRDLHFHDLRHEAISRLAEKLPNLIELSAVTGHKDLRMLKRYYHPRPEDLARKLG